MRDDTRCHYEVMRSVGSDQTTSRVTVRAPEEMNECNEWGV